MSRSVTKPVCVLGDVRVYAGRLSGVLCVSQCCYKLLFDGNRRIVNYFVYVVAKQLPFPSQHILVETDAYVILTDTLYKTYDFLFYFEYYLCRKEFSNY